MVRHKTDLVTRPKVDLVVRHKVNLVARSKIDLNVRQKADLVARFNTRRLLDQKYEIVNKKIKTHNLSNYSKHNEICELIGKI